MEWHVVNPMHELYHTICLSLTFSLVLRARTFVRQFIASLGFNNGEANNPPPATGSKPLTWDTSSVTSMQGQFLYAVTFNQDISDWCVLGSYSRAVLIRPDFFSPTRASRSFVRDVSAVKNMTSMFNRAASFDNGGLSLDWGPGTVSVEDMSGMFYYAELFTQPIGDWDTSSVVYMDYMFGLDIDRHTLAPSDPLTCTPRSLVCSRFSYATAFDQDVSDWDVSAVKSMDSMFNGATLFNNGGVALDWADTSSVQNMEGMFALAETFDQPLPLPGWDTSSVTSMAGMFFGAEVFDQDISGLDVSAVKFMDSMFENAVLFNQDISGWVTSSVTDMRGMFSGATVFSQDLTGWYVFDSRRSFLVALMLWCSDSRASCSSAHLPGTWLGSPRWTPARTSASTRVSRLPDRPLPSPRPAAPSDVNWAAPACRKSHTPRVGFPPTLTSVPHHLSDLIEFHTL